MSAVIIMLVVLSFLSNLSPIRTSDVVGSTAWGKWGRWDDCRNGSFVRAFSVKTESKHGVKDDTALNAARFQCYSKSGTFTEQISSTNGPWGRWGPEQRCHGGFFASLAMYSEEQCRRCDNTAANSIEMLCREDSGRNHWMKTGEGEFGWSTVMQTVHCPDGQAICGVQTRVQSRQGPGDDTALNQIKLKCCEY